MEVKTPGIQTNKSSVCKDMALAVAYSSVNSLWKSKQKNIDENLKSLCRSMILSITRCVNDYDTNWIGSTSSLITNAREAFEAVKKKHFVMDERTVHYFNTICFFGDMAVCYLVDRDKAMFSKTMSCFCSKTFNNTKGQEKVQAVAEKFV